MLVLSRKKGQRLHLGELVVLTVLESRHGRVRLGIEAPDDVVIRREEVSNKRPQAERPLQEQLRK